jgi:hypothetical protein
MFEEKSWMGRLWLKLHDRTGYKQYKWELKNYKQEEFTNFFTGNNRLNTLDKIIEMCINDKSINVNHSGNAGDIIYALPTLKKIHEASNLPVNLYLKLNQPLNSSGFTSHPLGNVMLNAKMVEMLMPLINLQPYINSCNIYTDQKIHVDLDFFRSGVIPLDRANIARWCGYITGATPELYNRWLTVQPDTSYADTVVLARSERYRNNSIDFSFLNKYSNIVFIGVSSEYNDIKKSIPGIQRVEVNDFLELARIIAGCKFFIGNQSFPFSIAEALKKPRILEAYYYMINVVPEGENGYDFFFQEHFEELVKHLNNSPFIAAD